MCVRAEKTAKTEADIRGILFEEKDVSSDNHCNVLGARISEHSMSKTMTFEQAKAFCEGKGGRLATRSEVLAAMAYLPDEAIRGRRSAAAQATIGCKIGEKNGRTETCTTKSTTVLTGAHHGVGRDHGARFLGKPCSAPGLPNWCGERE